MYTKHNLNSVGALLCTILVAIFAMMVTVSVAHASSGDSLLQTGENDLFKVVRVVQQDGDGAKTICRLWSSWTGQWEEEVTIALPKAGWNPFVGQVIRSVGCDTKTLWYTYTAEESKQIMHRLDNFSAASKDGGEKIRKTYSIVDSVKRVEKKEMFVTEE